MEVDDNALYSSPHIPCQPTPWCRGASQPPHYMSSYANGISPALPLPAKELLMTDNLRRCLVSCPVGSARGGGGGMRGREAGVGAGAGLAGSEVRVERTMVHVREGRGADTFARATSPRTSSHLLVLAVEWWAVSTDPTD